MWGNKIKIALFGESHGKAVGVTLEGLPSGFEIDVEELRLSMDRRKPKSDDFSTKRNETDEFTILSGVFNGKTTGSPLCAIINNYDVKSYAYQKIENTPRPGHADYTTYVKYNGFADIRGGGHLSGRLTAPLVLAGGICKQILKSKGVHICSHIYSIDNIYDTPLDKCNFDNQTYDKLRNSSFPVLNDEAERKMKRAISCIKKYGDSIGGIVECGVYGMPVGIGEPIFEGLESVISSIIFSIPAVKGVEFGAGFEVSNLRGSENNDEFYYSDDSVKTKTNNCGGILGGISNGMPVILKVAIKPTPSIAIEQNTVNLLTKENCKINISGRHDACIVPRACEAIECACAVAILDMIMR